MPSAIENSTHGERRVASESRRVDSVSAHQLTRMNFVLGTHPAELIEQDLDLGLASPTSGLHSRISMALSRAPLRRWFSTLEK